MRYLNAAFFVVLPAAAVSSLSNAQTNERPPSEGQFEPFHKHHDTHFGHDHFYPDRGSMIREIPKKQLPSATRDCPTNFTPASGTSLAAPPSWLWRRPSGWSCRHCRHSRLCSREA